MSFNLPTGKVQLPNFKGLICLDGERRVEESDLMMDKIIVGFTHEILHKILLEKEGLGTTLRWDLLDKIIHLDVTKIAYRISSIGFSSSDEKKGL